MAANVGRHRSLATSPMLRCSRSSYWLPPREWCPGQRIIKSVSEVVLVYVCFEAISDRTAMSSERLEDYPF